MTKHNSTSSDPSSDSSDSSTERERRQNNLIKKLVRRVKHLTKEVRENECKIKKNTIKICKYAWEPAYISAYGMAAQLITAGSSVRFDFDQTKRNFVHIAGSTDIVVQKDGLYEILFTLDINEPAQFTIFVNNIPILPTQTGVNSGAGQLCMNQLLELKCGDTVTVRNYTSATATGAVNIPETQGGSVPGTGVNVIITLMKIANLECDEEKCECIKSDSCSTSSKSDKGS